MTNNQPSQLEVIERRAATARGLVRYFTGKPCRHSHVAQRVVTSGKCVVCHLDDAKKWRSTNAERYSEIKAEWRRRNVERQRECSHDWYVNNGERYRDNQLRWRRENPARWRATMQANERLRYLRRTRACPKWEDARALRGIYEMRPAMHHVDHIVPLRGKTADGHEICGLHVHWNLQYLRAAENIRKGNRMRNWEQALCETARND